MALLPASASVSGGSTLGVVAVGVGIGVIAIATLFVALRFYMRISTRHGLWWDDWLIFAATVATFATAALVLAGNRIDQDSGVMGDTNDPNYTLLTSEDDMFMELVFISSVFYFLAAAATKLGILLMYARIFELSDGFRAKVTASSIMVIAWWVACTVATLLTCRPLNYIWTYDSGFPKFCFNFNLFWMATGVCEIVLDLMILALPIREVMGMYLSPRRKLSVMAVFLLGGFVVITGVIKVAFAYNPRGHIPLSGPAEICATLHTGLAIVCACLPILKPLIHRSVRTSSSTAVGYSSSGHSRGKLRTADSNIIHIDLGPTASDYSLFSKTPTTPSTPLHWA